MHGAGRESFPCWALTAAARTDRPRGRCCLLRPLLLLVKGVLHGAARRLQAAARIVWRGRPSPCC